jgi:hypothetical protein
MITTHHKVVKVEERKRLTRVDVVNRDTKDQEFVERWSDVGWAITLDNSMSLIFSKRPEFTTGDVIECRWRKVNGG